MSEVFEPVEVIATTKKVAPFFRMPMKLFIAPAPDIPISQSIPKG